MAAVEYAVWSHNGEVILNVPFKYPNIWTIESYWDDVTAYEFFYKRWSLSIYIALTYVAVIHFLEWVMKDRKPFGLKPILAAWNAMLAVFSICATYRYGIEFHHMMTTRPLFDSICYSCNPSEPAAFWAGMFALSKIVELGDTLFIVLRKRPLIFLHWYHHAVVLVYVWHAAIELVAAGRWFIFMNYAVHSIMYTYYTLTALGYRLPKSVSMTVTTLQTLQMLIGVFISCLVLFLKSQGHLCQQSYENLAICFAIYASFAVLFMNFFRNAYLIKKQKKE